MSKLAPRSCLCSVLDKGKGLFDFRQDRQDFDQTFHLNLINWPFSEAPPAAF